MLIRQFGCIWIGYTDGTCWEIYARDASLIEALRTSFRADHIAAIHASDFADRKRSLRSVFGSWPYEA